MKRQLLAIFFSILFAGQGFAGNIMGDEATWIYGATPAETTAQSSDNTWLSPSSIPYIKFGTYEKATCSVILTVLECSDTLITNYGWNGTADQTFTFPAAAAKMKVKFLNLVTDASEDIYFDTPGSATQFILDGTACGNGNRVWTDNATKYEVIHFHTFTEDGLTWDWYGSSEQGIWLNKGS